MEPRVLSLKEKTAFEKPEVSVVITTWNRRDLLRETLESFFSQSLAPDRFEVVVVDNNSDDGTDAMVEDLQKTAPFALRYFPLKEDRGVSAARNYGIVHAKSPIIATTDSDCFASPRWLEAGLAAFEDPQIAMVQGRTLPKPGQPRSFFEKTIESPPHEWPVYATCNMMYRTPALREVGYFDEECWRFRSPSGRPLGGEDVDLAWRLLSRGAVCRFVPDAVIYHEVFPRRFRAWLMDAALFYPGSLLFKRNPAMRKLLFARVFVYPLFDLAVFSLLVAAIWHWSAAILTLPYLFALSRRVGRGGKAVFKAGALAIKDALTLAMLIAGSFRYRSLVL